MLGCAYTDYRRGRERMQSVEKEALVPYTSQQMYDLVNDVTSYPSFVPKCEHTEVVTSSDTHMLAKMSFGWKGGWQYTLMTSNALVAHERISMKLEKGPFKFLEGGWVFESVDEACKVYFHLSFEFSNPLLCVLAQPLLGGLGDEVLAMFTKRAAVVYG